MKTHVLSGSFNTGKTTTMNALQNHINGRFHYAPDGGRAVLEELKTTREKLSHEDQQLFQLMIVEHYLREEAEAQNTGKDILSDSYMIETLAYGLPVLDDYSIKLIHALINQRKDTLQIIKFPVLEEIKMNHDGLRDTDVSYQKTIDTRIDNILHEHGIVPVRLQQKDVQGRVEEILHHIL